MTTRNDEGALVLNSAETALVARYVAGLLLADAPDSVDWGELPNLTEDGYVEVVEAVAELGRAYTRAAGPAGAAVYAEVVA